MVQNVTFRSLSACNLTGAAAAPAHATAERVAGVSGMTRLMERATSLLEPPHAFILEVEQRSVPHKSLTTC